MQTGIGELDRVLGGGLVPGSLVLLGGDPGHRQVDAAAAGARRAGARRQQGALRLGRGVGAADRAARRAAGRAHQGAARAGRDPARAHPRRRPNAMRPAVLAVDSVQTVHSAALESIPGSLGQVREAAGRLLTFAKTKRRAGDPRRPRHQGRLARRAEDARARGRLRCSTSKASATHNYRVLRATKNRFGSTNEIGVFEMRAEGLAEVPNPSALFLAERPLGAPGSVVVAVGRRLAADPRRDPGAGGARRRACRAAPRSASIPTASRCCSR